MLYIGGGWQEAASGRRFESRDPASGKVLDSVADAGAEDVRAAIDAADAAFESWAGLTAYQRAGYLMAAHRLMLERQEALARLMTEEQGKPLRMARTEVAYAADFLSWFAEEAKRVYGESIPSSRADQRFLVLRQPIGVVVLYGVLISMVLTLVVVPAVYALVARNTRSPQYWTGVIQKLRAKTPAAPAAEPT